MVVIRLASGRFQEASVLPRRRHRFPRGARQQLRRDSRTLQSAHQAGHRAGRQGARRLLDQEGRAAVGLGPDADRAPPDAGAGRRGAGSRTRPRNEPPFRHGRRRRGAGAGADRSARRGARRPSRSTAATTLVELYVGAGRARPGDRQAGTDGRGAPDAGGDARARRKARRSRSRSGTDALRAKGRGLQGRVPDWDEMAVVGRIARAHGLRGQVIVNPETDFPAGAVSARAPSCSSTESRSCRTR